MARERSALATRVGVVLCGLALSSCSSLRIYSDVRDKQGEAAKAAWAQVDLATIITTERANLKKLLDAELDAQDKLAVGIRDFRLRGVLGGGKTLQEGLLDPIERRFRELATSDAEYGKYRASLVARRAWEENVDASFAVDFKFYKLDIPRCSEIAGGKTPEAIEKRIASANAGDALVLREMLSRLRGKCPEPKVTLPPGAIAAADGRRAAEEARITALKQKAKDLQSEYAAALDAYNAAVAAATPDSNTSAARVKAAAERIGKAVDALESAQDAFSAQFLAKARLDSIEKFVKAVTEGGESGNPPEGASRAETVAIVVPKLVDDARAALAEAKKPLALPLVIRRDQEKLKLEAANREIAARQAMVKLSRDIVDILAEEAYQLWMAKRELADAKVPMTKPIAEAFGDPSPKAREKIYSAAARYFDSVNRLTARRYKLEYMLVAASHELSLAYAEVNIKQWESLIGTAVDQLADYSAGGIKAEQISNLINTLGILWIGKGVNK